MTVDPSLTLRTITDDEFVAYGRAMERVFLEATSDEEIEWWRPLCPTDRFLAVTDSEGRFVGTAGSHPFEVSMPGADPVACAGVTAVTVRPDHRRRGMLRAMMQRLLDDAVAAGEPWAALYASEGGIYGRFGFGPAAPALSLETARDELATVGGDVEQVSLLDAEEAKKGFPEVAAAHGRMRGGMVQRDAAWWSMWLDHHQDKSRDGELRHRWHAVVPGRGYVAFRANDGDWARRRPDGVLLVEELVANDPDAAASLWSFVASVDLVTTIRAPHRPPDDPLPFLVANEAAVYSTPSSPMWFRLVDAPAALTSRGYSVTDRLVFEVADDQLPGNAGRWSLDVAPDGAMCSRTDDDPDVVLTTATLATLAFGGHRATRLADAGILAGPDVAVFRRLDRLFAVDRSPWTPFEF